MLKAFKPYLRTVREARLLGREIELLEQSMYQMNKEGDAFNRVLHDDVRIEIADIIKEILARGEIGGESLVLRMKEYLSQIESVQLILPIQPSEGFTDKLHSWVEQTLGEKYVMDIVYDRQMLGGVKVVLGGKYLDYSLSRRISAKLPEKVAEAYAAISNVT